MVGQVFINYRRNDTLATAQELKRELQERLKGIDVYLDVDENRGGEPYIDRINEEIRTRKVFICMIGPKWLEVGPAAEGEAPPIPRIKQKDDLVRKEIEAAILRNKQILPIRVAEVDMPTRDALPDTLFTLPEKHARPLRDGKGRSNDLAAIAHDVKRMLKAESKWGKWRERAREIGLILFVVSICGTAGFVLAHAMFPDTLLARQANWLGGVPSYTALLQTKSEFDQFRKQEPLREEVSRLKQLSEVTNLVIERDRLKEERDQLQRKLDAIDHGGVPYNPVAAMAIIGDIKGLLDQERSRASALALERDKLQQVLSAAREPEVAKSSARSGADQATASKPSGDPVGAKAPALMERMGVCNLTGGRFFRCP